jgi:hypothetical protein
MITGPSTYYTAFLPLHENFKPYLNCTVAVFVLLIVVLVSGGS